MVTITRDTAADAAANPRLCVFVRCVRSHAAGAHEGTVHFAELPHLRTVPRVGQRHPPCFRGA